MRIVVMLLAIASAHGLFLAEGATFQDIQYWVGSGTNRAGFEIDWNDGETNHAMAWGYRWNGEANGEQMLRAIVSNAPRLYAEVSGITEFGVSLFGFGFDSTPDNRFPLNPPLTFDGQHIATSDYGGTQEDRAPLDAEDRWQEGGPTSGYWSYYVSTDKRLAVNSADWSSSGVGMTGRALADGDWDGWSFAFDFNGPPPADPVAAIPVSPFAVEVTAIQGPFGAPPYDDPQAVLGEPTSMALNFDPVVGNTPFRVKLVAPAYNTDLEGRKVFVTLDRSDTNGLYSYASITAKFDHQVQDDPANPYGIDFQVFGNSFYPGDGFANEASDMRTYNIVGGTFAEPTLVSVSPDGLRWYTYTNGPFADSAFPTQGYEWDSTKQDATGNGWTTNRMDFTKPVNPALDSIIGAPETTLAASDAIRLYAGSGGGTGFDLAESGFQSIQYIRVQAAWESYGGEVDAFADVRPAILGESLTLTPRNLTNSTAELYFQDPIQLGRNLLRLRVHSLDRTAFVTPTRLSDPLMLGALSTKPLEAVQLNIVAALGVNAPSVDADLRLNVATLYSGDGGDLDAFVWKEQGWVRSVFAFDATLGLVRLSGVTGSVTIAVVKIVQPRLTIASHGDEIELSFVPVAGWTHVLEQISDSAVWRPVTSLTPSNPEPVVLREPVVPNGHALYRLRLTRP